jgi:hypothetical protein
MHVKTLIAAVDDLISTANPMENICIVTMHDYQVLIASREALQKSLDIETERLVRS